MQQLALFQTLAQAKLTVAVTAACFDIQTGRVSGNGTTSLSVKPLRPEKSVPVCIQNTIDQPLSQLCIADTLLEQLHLLLECVLLPLRQPEEAVH